MWNDIYPIYWNTSGAQMIFVLLASFLFLYILAGFKCLELHFMYPFHKHNRGPSSDFGVAFFRIKIHKGQIYVNYSSNLVNLPLSTLHITIMAKNNGKCKHRSRERERGRITIVLMYFLRWVDFICLAYLSQIFRFCATKLTWTPEIGPVLVRKTDSEK